MFFDSHGVEQDIMLRTEAKVFANLHHISPNINSINVSGSSTWWQKTCSHKLTPVMKNSLRNEIFFSEICSKESTNIQDKCNYTACWNIVNIKYT